MRRSIPFILAIAVLGISATVARRSADSKPSDEPPPLQ